MVVSQRSQQASSAGDALTVSGSAVGKQRLPDTGKKSRKTKGAVAGDRVPCPVLDRLPRLLPLLRLNQSFGMGRVFGLFSIIASSSTPGGGGGGGGGGLLLGGGGGARSVNDSTHDQPMGRANCCLASSPQGVPAWSSATRVSNSVACWACFSRALLMDTSLEGRSVQVLFFGSSKLMPRLALASIPL